MSLSGSPVARVRPASRSALLIDARFLVLAMLLEYHYTSGGRAIVSLDYTIARSILDGVYASARLELPLEGILLVGY